jgi:O-antigen/teichoic acid export membrane protein
MEAFSIYSSYYNAQKKYLDWMVTEFLNQALSTTALFLTIYFTHNIYALVTVYFLTYIILRFAIVIYIFKTNTFSQDYNKDYISYGKTMSWFQIITRSISTIDQIILFNLTGPAALAVFAIANSIPMRAQSVVKITATLAFPKYSRYTEEQILKTLPIKMFYFGVLLFMTSCFYAAIAPTLFKYLLPKYLNSVHYSQALIFFIVSAMTYPYSTYMVVFKKVKEQYIMALLNISVKILCLVIFIPLYGVWGAVFGVLAGSYSLIFSAYYFIWRNKKQLSGN